MTLGKLGKQIARELRQNPKKAVILAGMCVVALYYWVPILRRWSSADVSPASKTASATAPTQPTPTSRHWAVRRWEEVAAAIDADPQMQPVDVNMSWNPFAAPDENEEESQTEPERETDIATTPQDVGLELQSTIVGKHRQTAVINGVAYGTGNWVTAPDATTIRYRLVEITHDTVILERHGQRYTLTLEANDIWAPAASGAENDVSEKPNGPL